MSSTKNRDLAQELVDFLLKEETTANPTVKGDEKITSAKEQKTAQLASSSVEMKTFAITPELAAAKITADQYPVTKLEKITPTPLIEFDLDLGDGNLPEVDFTKPQRKTSSQIKIESDGPSAVLPQTKKQSHNQAKNHNQVKVHDYNKNKNNDAGKSYENNSNSNSNSKQSQGKNKSQTLTKHDDSHLTNGRGRSIFNEVDHLLGSVEAVKVSQERITLLEGDRDQLRSEIDKLLATSESLECRLNESKAEQEKIERRHKEKVEILEEEKVVLTTRINAREDELLQIKRELSDFKGRFQGDLRKIRVRERDLESRHELLRAENSAVVKSKDEMILELKRQLEQLQYEVEGFRTQSADLNSTINDYSERNQRTVKALRLALSILESGDIDEREKKVG
jgi:hypothetical protein